ncbi:MAG: D-alanine--D-alanine ligase [Phycisphaerae bacterium]|nr:D-alanine--D-alanine ligase [Phycisphaerae bacterium]
MALPDPLTVLVLAGGPDAEREVSLQSARGVAEALARLPRFRVEHRVIGRPALADLGALPGDVVFPALHGQWGEGGPLQDLLEADGRPYVGCRPPAARAAIDKIRTKLIAAGEGIPTPDCSLLHPSDPACPLDPPVVLKPVHEGSTIGVHLVLDPAQWGPARDAAVDDIRHNPGRVYMVERYVAGRELTAGLLAPERPDATHLPLIEIRPASGFYDYEAKYARDDTVYDTAPVLPEGVAASIADHSRRLCRALGVRHLARVDFRLDPEGRPWLLETNTMPGFTGHSLVPMAAAKAGIDFPSLCARLVDLAWEDRAPGRVHLP